MFNREPQMEAVEIIQENLRISSLPMTSDDIRSDKKDEHDGGASRGDHGLAEIPGAFLVAVDLVVLSPAVREHPSDLCPRRVHFQKLASLVFDTAIFFTKWRSKIINNS